MQVKFSVESVSGARYRPKIKYLARKILLEKSGMRFAKLPRDFSDGQKGLAKMI